MSPLPTCHEIADGIYRLSTYVPGLASPKGLTVNQFLVVADQPLLFHTGFRSLAPDVASGIDRIVELHRLRWVSFGHVEADECGGLDRILGLAPSSRPVLPRSCCEFSARDLSDRPAYAVDPARALDLGGRMLRFLPTANVPHNREAHVVFEEATGTLLCGDLLLQEGPAPAFREDVAERALGARHVDGAVGGRSGAAAMAAALRRMAELEPRTLAPMHGSCHEGDAGAVLRAVADGWAAADGRDRE